MLLIGAHRMTDADASDGALLILRNDQFLDLTNLLAFGDIGAALTLQGPGAVSGRRRLRLRTDGRLLVLSEPGGSDELHERK